MKNPTASQWSLIRSDAERLKGMTQMAGLDATFLAQLHPLLDQVSVEARVRAEVEATKGNTSASGVSISKDGVITLSAPVVKPTHNRAPRVTPAGSFGLRFRDVVYRGTVFQNCETIAHAVVRMCDAHFKHAAQLAQPSTQINAVEFAAAIKAAYPDSTYSEHRVVPDVTKYAHGRFACQKDGWAPSQPVVTTFVKAG